MRGSYIPSREQRELRELVRYRKTLIRERSAEVNRLQKTLEGANIKLASVASDITGKSGRAMLEALVAGTADPKALAAMAQGQLQKKRPQLEQALYGLIGRHQHFQVKEARYDPAGPLRVGPVLFTKLFRQHLFLPGNSVEVDGEKEAKPVRSTIQFCRRSAWAKTVSQTGRTSGALRTRRRRGSQAMGR